MKQLYTVTVELNAVVWAESPAEAKQIAYDQRAITDQASNLWIDDYDAYLSHGLMPDNTWSLDDLVFHEGDYDLTIRECLETEK